MKSFQLSLASVVIALVTIGFGSEFSLRGAPWVVTENLRLAATNTEYEGHDLLVRSARLEIEGAHNFGLLRVIGTGEVILPSEEVRFSGVEILDSGKLRIAGGGRLTVDGDLTLADQARATGEGVHRTEAVSGEWLGRGVAVSARNLRLSTGAVFEADAQGYIGGWDRGRRGQGPGGGGPGGDFGPGGGAGHGGDGARPASRPQVYNGSAYGDPMEPVQLGSGGGGAEFGRSGAGGGAIRLDIRGLLHLDGVIRANGEDGLVNSGGGAGGSLLVHAEELGGEGVFEAKGGQGGGGGGGGAAGGRVAIYSRSSRYSGQARCSVEGGGAGGEGTLVFIDTSRPGTGVSIFQRLALPNATTYHWGEIRVFSGGLLALGTDTRLAVERDLTLADDGEMVLGGGAWIGVTNHLHLSGSNALVAFRSKDQTAPIDGRWRGVGATLQAGQLTVHAQAGIRADGQGYAGGQDRGRRGDGPGGGGPAGDFGVAGGGGYGGSGARPVFRPQVYGGPTNGNARLPLDLGSGGGGAEYSTPGSGGGAIHLIVGDRFLLDGVVSANGADGTGNAGGGSGGSVLVQAGTLSGAGRIEALGGAGGPPNAGGGGGGRIAVYTWNQAFFPPASYRVDVGAQGVDGTAGSRVLGGPEAGILWSGFERALSHGVIPIGWADLGVNPIGATVTLVLAGEGLRTEIVAGKLTRDTFTWDTTGLPDGEYELRVVVRDAAGRVRREWPRQVALNNTAQWHTGGITRNETWSADVLHLVEGDLGVDPGVTLRIAPGAVVKMAPGAVLYVPEGATVDARGSDGAEVVFTSLRDDLAAGDSNHDGARSIPQPGDWQVALHGRGQWLSNEATRLRYARQQHRGTLTQGAHFAAHVLHEILDELRVPEGQALIVEPGAVLKFHAHAGLRIDPGARLQALGTLTEPITFTSVLDDSVGGDTNNDGPASTPAAGDWRWLHVGGLALLEHAELRYGGGTPSGQWDATGTIRCDSGAQLVLRRSQLLESRFDGVLGFGSVLLENCVLRASDRALAVHGGKSRALNCTFDDNRLGIQLHGGQLELLNSIVTRSATAGMVHDLGLPNYSVRHCAFWNPAAVEGDTGGIPDLLGRDHNRAVDPGFVDAEHGDFRLSFLSPVIDAADGSVAPASDRMDAPRYDDPRTANSGVATGSGAFADLGAYEFVETAESDLDLIVQEVAGPAEVVAGETVRITWTLRNIGAGIVNRSWHDGISLEPVDAPASSRPVLAATTLSSAVLGPGQAWTFSAEVRVPRVSEGCWRWTVRANQHGEVFEGRNAQNNLGAATIDTQVRVPRLARGVPLETAFRGEGADAGYRLDPDATHAWSVLVDAVSTQGRTTLYAAAGRMPTPSDFDWRSPLAASADARLSIPAGTRAGPIYLLLVPEALADGQLAYTVRADQPAFELTSIGLARAGNMGEVSVPLNGSGFEPGLDLRLESNSAPSLAARSVALLTGDSAVATFDLRHLAPGLYDVVARQGGEQRRLDGAFLVDAGGAAVVRARVVLPTVVRAGRPFTAFVEYANEGEVNAPAPLLVLRVVGGQSTLHSDLDPEAGGITLSFLGLAQGSTAPDVLPPGARFSLPFQVLAAGTDTVRCDLFVHDGTETTPMDYLALSAAVAPVTASDLWVAAWQSVASQAGPTVGEFVRTLGQAAARAARLGVAIATERQALDFLVRESVEQIRTAPVRGQLLLGDATRPLGDVVVYFQRTPRAADIDIAAAEVFTARTWFDGTFAVPGLTPGDYALTVPGYAEVRPATLTLTSPTDSALTNLLLVVPAPLARLRGEATDGLGGAPVAGSRVEATHRSSGATRVVWTDAQGKFEIEGVPVGEHRLRAQVAGRLASLPQIVTAVEAGTAWASLVFPGTGGTVSGVVRDAAGHPVASASISARPDSISPNSDAEVPLPTTSASDGRYSIAGLGLGTYRLSAWGPSNTVSATTLVTITRPSENRTEDLRLLPGLGLSGHVVDATTQRPITNALTVLGALRRGERAQRTDALGAFSDTTLGPGTHWLAAWAPGYLPRLIAMTDGANTNRAELQPGDFTPWVSQAPGTSNLPPTLVSSTRALMARTLAGNPPQPWTAYLPPEMYTYPPTLYVAYWMAPELKRDNDMFEAALLAFAKLKNKCKSLNTDKVIADLNLMSEAIEDVRDRVEDFVDAFEHEPYQPLERAFAAVIDLPTDLHAALDGIAADCALPEFDPGHLALRALQDYSVETLLKTYRGNFQLEWNLAEIERQLSDLEAHFAANDLGPCTTLARSTLLRFRDGVLPDTRLKLQRLQSLDDQHGNVYSELLEAVGRYSFGAASFDEDFPRMFGRGKGCGGGGEDGGIEEPPIPPCQAGTDPRSLAAADLCPPDGWGAAKVVGSFDPNDKITTGYGSSGFIHPDESIRYTIHFENVATASAPAQEVTITDVLDARLDVATLQPIAFGFNGATLEVPTGALPFSGLAFVATDPNPVLASVSLDPSLGIVRWHMQSVNPRTGTLPDDPLAGFLPPNDSQHRGEGFVTFSVRTKPGTSPDTIITNRASIVFDLNAPILTPTVTNRIDAAPPESRVRRIASDDTGLWLDWTGSDGDGSGIASYAVFVSRNGGPFRPWKRDEPETGSYFPVLPGSTHAFYSVAVDAVGNRESPPADPDLLVTTPVRLHLVSTRPLTLVWSTDPEVAYVVERARTLDPVTAWTVVAESVSGTSGTATWVDSESEDAAFYRVRIR